MAERLDAPALAEEVEEDEDEERPPLRLSRRGILVLSGLGAAVLGLLGWVLYFSSALDVQTVAIQGLRNDQLTVDEVRAAIGPVQHGPLARVDLDAVQRRVQAIPRVAKAEVWRGWPHTLRVKVIERQPVAAVKDSDGKFTQMDASGVSFATEATAPAGVPVVELQLSAPAQDAISAFPQSALVAAAVKVAAGLPSDVAKGAPSLLVRSYDDIELRLAGGATVRWGSAERTDRKATVLLALLKQKAANYDVSAPDAPAISG
ncbi:FtsQ-type POTRA domain-containing protein [Kitasatospora sp. NBC_01287]|uniref:cell division protein FtsQ/DivIB n=1 Tax=Kitasatospora sp. NBC_01287 TaxID=2903573 RepID=UPI002254AA4E|nr:FtsQ-type POTRA domain-containing protein [Kitasatospora sp. NBC_01287]MCX4749612.1 FtsQ-type POTRA domain-containing protein [Kitasatospora sp. NBC_01287]